MRLKLVSIMVAVIIILVGCQDSGNKLGRTDDNLKNVERTRNVENFDQNRNMDKRNDRHGDIVNNRDRDNNRMNTRNINNRDNEYDISEEAADEIVDKVAEISRAYVITTENNAYVAAMLDNDNNDTDFNKQTNRSNRKNLGNHDRDNGEELTEAVENQIADIVRNIDNDIDHVYVTTNPDFMDLTNDYINDMDEGKPIRGFFDQIGNMIERVFPQDRR